MLLANVPPNRANYQQRSGRAGRRNDGSTMVALFARAFGYEQAVFRAFFGRELRKPRIFLDRDRFARLHLQAFLLGEFFREALEPQHVGAMDAFGRMGWFCRRDRLIVASRNTPPLRESAPPYRGLLRPAWWGPDTESAAQQFSRYMRSCAQHDSIPREALTVLLAATLLAEEPPAQLMTDAHAVFRKGIEEGSAATICWSRPGRDVPTARQIVPNATPLRIRCRNWRRAVSSSSWPTCGFCRGTAFLGLQALRLPPSGFGERGESSVQLERDGMLALNEYVPGSRVLAGGKVFHSRGVMRSFDHDGAFGVRHFRYKCHRAHVFYDT